MGSARNSGENTFSPRQPRGNTRERILELVTVYKHDICEK